MNTEFCTNCGTRHEYSLNKPNFCSSCGKSLNGITAQGAQENLDEENSREDLAENCNLPILSKLEYNIEKSSPPLTFGDLLTHASQDPNGSYERVGRAKPERQDGADIQKQMIEECRSAQKPSKVSE